MEAPQYPVGAYIPETDGGPARRAELIEEVANAPAALRRAVAGLSAKQLETRYRNWTIRQIVHHIADSHLNAYIRFKLALTEDNPTIKPYNEGLWVTLADDKTGEIQPTLDLLDALHERWVTLLQSMTSEHYARAYIHPEYGKRVTLSEALSDYAWHGRHHTGQILWLRQQHSWGGNR